MAMALPLYYSAEMVRALPDDGNRYETVHGELLVSPAPMRAHQRVLMRLIEQLQPYLRAHPVGELIPSPADVSEGLDILVQLDLFAVEIGQARGPVHQAGALPARRHPRLLGGRHRGCGDRAVDAGRHSARPAARNGAVATGRGPDRAERKHSRPVRADLSCGTRRRPCAVDRARVD